MTRRSTPRSHFDAAIRSNVWSAYEVFAVIALIQIISSGPLWAISLIGDLIAAALLRSMMRGELSAGPVAVHCGFGVLLVLGDSFRLGVFVSIAMMLAFGEVMAASRFASSSMPDVSGRPSRTVDAGPPLAAFATAMSAGLAVVATAELPGSRPLSGAVIVAAVIVAITLHRLRLAVDRA